MRKLEQFALSIQHYFQSRGKYRLHSDLAYRLYTEVHKEQKKASQTTGILHGLMNYPPTEKGLWNRTRPATYRCYQS